MILLRPQGETSSSMFQFSVALAGHASELAHPIGCAKLSCPFHYAKGIRYTSILARLPITRGGAAISIKACSRTTARHLDQFTVLLDRFLLRMQIESYLRSYPARPLHGL